MHKSLIILLSFGILFIHFRPWMAVCTAIISLNQTWFSCFFHVGVFCAAWWYLRELSHVHNKATIHASALHWVLHNLKTRTNTVFHALRNMKDQCTIKQKYMLSSTDNNLMMFLFYFESFWIGYLYFSNPHCLYYIHITSFIEFSIYQSFLKIQTECA